MSNNKTEDVIYLEYGMHKGRVRSELAAHHYVKKRERFDAATDNNEKE